MNTMKTAKMITCVLGSVLVLNSTLQSQITTFHDLYVGTAAAPNLQEVNWGTRGEQTGGGWGVSKETFLGFTLTSLFDGVEDKELSYTAGDSRTLGVAGIGNNANPTTPGTIHYRTNTNNGGVPGREGIQLAVPAEGALVGVIGGSDKEFAGISRVFFDRLNNGTGNIVTISGFVADPQASWVVQPNGGEDLSYNTVTGTLTFSTPGSGDLFGVLAFDNLGATLSETGVSLVFSNDRANNNNSYGLVGWQYAAVPEAATQALIAGLALLGFVLVRRRWLRARE
jgi:hypothetical protein